ncbi:transcription factor IIA large subunit [Musa troglodytarum]|uniref:Transcription factor IIA large subunit n=1 Tax=Musa troglodytarum TaxID=320322 RepID=A0A9E7F2P9_9LILI|nr:transcription factor IIA large subunit [Musa troglodytarum]
MGVPKVIADLRNRAGSVDVDRPGVGILAFEAAAAMSLLVSLHLSLAEDEVRRLCADMRSKGVAYLTSKDEPFLLRLAYAELVAELDKAAATVSRLGANLGLGSTAKGVEKLIKRMERYVVATSRLYAEMEALNELEATERRMEQWRRHSGSIPVPKPGVPPAFESVHLELRSRRHKVRRLKEESLWNKTYDEAVELMVRAVITVFTGICAVFGPYVLRMLPRRDRRHRVLIHRSNPDYPGKHSSGPLETPTLKDVLFQRSSAPITVVKESRDKPSENLSRLLKADPTTLGGSGLALRYGNMIVLAEKLLKTRSVEGHEQGDGKEAAEAAARVELYQMMPSGMRTAVRAKLRECWKKEGGTVDGSLAEGWREAAERILAWLGPVARDTLRWQEEHNMERQQRFHALPRALMLQTLHFSDRVKTEAAIVELSRPRSPLSLPLLSLSLSARRVLENAPNPNSRIPWILPRCHEGDRSPGMANNVSAVYIHVLDDVISKVRDEFINYGVGEGVLNELQALWEVKMRQCGAISGNIERSALPKNAAPITPVHDLNVPYEGPAEEYETPTAEMLFPPTPLQTPIQTPLPGTNDPSMYNIPTGPSDYAPSPISDIRNSIDLKAGRPGSYMQPPSPWMSQRPLGVDVNVAYDEGREEPDRGSSHQHATQDFFMNSSGKRKRDDYASHINSGGYIPQQDGSGDVTIELSLTQDVVSQVKTSSIVQDQGTADSKFLSKKAEPALMLPQHDGIHDEYDDLFHLQGVANEDYNTPGDHVELRAATPSVGTPKPSKNDAGEDDEPPLNEDDDDELDDLDQEEEETNTQHLVLALFDKVSRTKSRWKCTLKDGIMHLNNRDILFNKLRVLIL